MDLKKCRKKAQHKENFEEIINEKRRLKQLCSSILIHIDLPSLHSLECACVCVHARVCGREVSERRMTFCESSTLHRAADGMVIASVRDV